MVEHLLEAVEVEAVADVLLVDLAEELVILEVAEPADPPVAFLRAVRAALRHYNLLLNYQGLVEFFISTFITNLRKRTL